jgi:hypothetical protein
VWCPCVGWNRGGGENFDLGYEGEVTGVRLERE